MWCVVCSVYILIWGVRCGVFCIYPDMGVRCVVCGVFCIYPDMGGEVWGGVVCSVYILIWG